MCRKHLLYTNGCTAHKAEAPRGEAWQEMTFSLAGNGLGAAGDWVPRGTSLSVANASGGRVLDLDRVAVRDAEGRDLLRNADFADGSHFWFFSSDRHHLPWHAKSLPLHYFVEQGWLGLVAFVLIFSAAMFRLVFGRGSAHPLAPAVAGGLVGVAVVGVFDSLVDAPRTGFLLFSLLFVGLGLRGRGDGT